jgi:hypothetical protein
VKREVPPMIPNILMYYFLRMIINRLAEIEQPKKV